MNDFSEAACCNVSAHLQHRWVKADVVIHGEDLLWHFRGQLHDRSGFLRSHGQRLFANDMLARLQCGDALRIMILVGRRDMHHVHLIAIHQSLVVVPGEHARDVPLLRDAACLVRAADGADANTVPLQSFNVDGPDKARADNTCSQFVDLPGQA